VPRSRKQPVQIEHLDAVLYGITVLVSFAHT
jgi:hypothetical protein